MSEIDHMLDDIDNSDSEAPLNTEVDETEIAQLVKKDSIDQQNIQRFNQIIKDSLYPGEDDEINDRSDTEVNLNKIESGMGDWAKECSIDDLNEEELKKARDSINSGSSRQARTQPKPKVAPYYASQPAKASYQGG